MKYYLLLSIICLSFISCERSVQPTNTVLILAATDIEFNNAKELIRDCAGIGKTPFQSCKGAVNNSSVVLVKSGVGKVNATLATSFSIQRYNPTLVIAFGLAGSLNPSLKAGDVVYVQRVAEHDFGNFKDEGLEPFGAKWISLAVEKGEPVASAVTGSQFISSQTKRKWLKERFGADIVDMESFGIAKVCEVYKSKCMILRIISDSADVSASKDYSLSEDGLSKTLAGRLPKLIYATHF